MRKLYSFLYSMNANCKSFSLIVFFIAISSFLANSQPACLQKAVQFDGIDDFVGMGTCPNLSVTGALTMEAWIFPTGTGDPGLYGGVGGMIINKEGEYEISMSPTGLQYAIANDLPGWEWTETNYMPPLNVWTHIALTYDYSIVSGGGMIRLYANTVLEYEILGSGPIHDEYNGTLRSNPLLDEFNVGSRQNGFSGTFFEGAIDEVRIWKAALSQAEILAWYNTNVIPSHPQYANIIGYWKFDEGAGIFAADALGRNNGTLMGSVLIYAPTYPGNPPPAIITPPSWTEGAPFETTTCGEVIEQFPCVPPTTGCLQKAVQFDGIDDLVDMGSCAGLSVTGSLTMEAWIFPTGIGEAGFYGGVGGMIINKEGEYEISMSPTGLQYAIANDLPGWGWTETNYMPPLNAWTHIALTYDYNSVSGEGVIRLYANAVLVYEFLGSGPIDDEYKGEEIGNLLLDEFNVGSRQNGFTGTFFEGAIDEVRIWKTALSQADILDWFNTNVIPSHPQYANIIGYWKFDEGVGIFAADALGMNNGTLMGSVLIYAPTYPGNPPPAIITPPSWTSGAPFETTTCGEVIEQVPCPPVPPLTITCPDDIPISCDASTLPEQTGSATALPDNVIPPEINYIDEILPGSCSSNYTIERTWMATDNVGGVTTCVQIITVTDNTAPLISTEAESLDATLQCSNTAGIAAALDLVPTATDNCATTPTMVVVSDETDDDPTCPDAYIRTRVWNFTDGCGNTSANFTQVITVIDNTVPTASNPAPVNVLCISNIPAANPNVVIDEADNCSTPTVALYSETNNGGSGGPGNPYIVTRVYRVTDACGNYKDVTHTLTALDNSAPILSTLTVDPTSLWPPNHKMKDIILTYSSGDNCGLGSCVVSVTSNEPVNGLGDGNTEPDWEIVNDHLVRLRAERSGTGNGRIYTITVTCTDASGNSTSKSATVIVAHNIGAPVTGSSFKIGTTLSLAGTFWDKLGNKHTAKWLIDNTIVNGTVSSEPTAIKNGTVKGSYKPSAAGVYKLQMNVIDQKGITSYANTNGYLQAIAVIYEAIGSYSYGGGWFTSPKGAMPASNSPVGTVSFGFTTSYYKGAIKGETQFDFKIGDFEFNALTFNYFEVKGPRAQFKGSGKTSAGIAYEFTITVIDGQKTNGGGVDKIRMKIYNKNTGVVIYDSQPGDSDAANPTIPVGSGSSIVIVSPNIQSAATPANRASADVTATEASTLPEGTFEVKVLNNPSKNNEPFKLQLLSSDTKLPINIRVMDGIGRPLELKQNLSANQTVEIGRAYIQGVYYAEVIQGAKRKVIKLIKMR